MVPLVLLVGCSSSGGSQARTAGSSAVHSSAAASTVSSSPAAAVLSGSDRRQIAMAFATFFGGATSAARAQQFLQHGATFAGVLAQQAGSSQAKTLSARVTAVRPKTSHVAAVTFTLSSGGAALLPNASGYAVDEAGRWKVAAATFCQLLKLQNAAPKQCNDASITALPAD